MEPEATAPTEIAITIPTTPTETVTPELTPELIPLTTIVQSQSPDTSESVLLGEIKARVEALEVKMIEVAETANNARTVAEIANMPEPEITEQVESVAVPSEVVTESQPETPRKRSTLAKILLG